MTQKTIDKYAEMGLTKDKLVELFCQQTLSTPQIAKLYNLSDSVVYALIKSLGIKRSAEDEAHYKARLAQEQSIRQANPEYQARKRAKYRAEHGHDSWHASPEGRAKLSQVQLLDSTKEKIQQTCLDKYGHTSYSGSDAFYATLENSQARAKQTCREKFGTDYWSQSSIGKAYLTEHVTEHNKKVAQTCLERYGTTNPNELQEIKDKIASTKIKRYGATYIDEFNDKIKATKLERYGDACYNNVPQMRATKLNRYGDENYVNPDKAQATRALRHGSIKESYQHAISVRVANLTAKYGETLPQFYSDTVKQGWKTRDRIHGSREHAIERQFLHAAENLGFNTIDEYFDWWTDQRLNTERARYNVKNHYPNVEKYQQTAIKNWGSIEALRAHSLEKCIETMQTRYGVQNAFQLPDVKGRYAAHSKVNIAFGTLLDSLDITYEEEFPLGSKLYDFKIGNTLVEIDPTATHNSTYSIFSKDANPLPAEYHYLKSQLAADNGFRCIHVWDWDSWRAVASLLQPKTTIGARKCSLIDLSNDKQKTKEFIDAYHVQGQCNGTIVSLALCFDQEIVQLMTFGKPRYNKNYEWELLRLCTKSSLTVVGGASKLFKHFISTFNPSSIISYCDNAKFTGDVYSSIGMTLVDQGHPTKHWSYMKDPKIHVTDNLLRQRGFDQLFGNRFGYYGKGTNNEELMLQHNFVTVYDCGQSVYEWKSS